MFSVPLPPRWVRRFVVTPIVYLGCLAVTLASPLLHLLLLLFDIFDLKRRRFSRLGGLGIALCVSELIGLTIAFALWVGSGFGARIHTEPFQRAHNKIFGWWLELVTRALRFYLGFEFVMPTTERITGPILTFARHAGPGDAFLLARTVIQDYHRQLRMLGTSKLLWDPFMNHVTSRLPYHFCDPAPKDLGADLREIADMCTTMGDDSVMIIFPEGGNWTPRRWDRAIERLTSRDHPELAARATAMTHVLPPRTAGAVAALRARNDITIVFVAHVGLDDLYSLRQIWKNVPLRRQVQAAYWSVPAETIPTDRAAISNWLFEQWEAVDQWIGDHEIRIQNQH